jgi:hypothetical protein
LSFSGEFTKSSKRLAALARGAEVFHRPASMKIGLVGDEEKYCFARSPRMELKRHKVGLNRDRTRETG